MHMDGHDCAQIREMNVKATTKPIPTIFLEALTTPDDGCVCVAAAPPDELVLVEFVLDAGPAVKKFPAIGLPKPSSRANTETLNAEMGVNAFTSCETEASKPAGCT